MNHSGGESLAIQALGNSFGSALGPCKHQALSRFLGQQPLQHLLLSVQGYFERLYAYIFRWLRCRAEGQPHRVAQVILHDAHHVAFHRCGKTHRLAFFWKNRHDAPDRGKKSHVQHAVRFIEDEDAQCVEMKKSAVEVVFEPPRSRHNQPRSLANGLELRTFGQSANDQRRGQQLLAAKRIELLHHLHGQFARWHKNQRRNSRRLILEQFFDHRDQERQRLARPRLRRRQHIFTFQRLRDRRRLHGSRRRKLRRRQSLLYVRRNQHFRKSRRSAFRQRLL